MSGAPAPKPASATRAVLAARRIYACSGSQTRRRWFTSLRRRGAAKGRAATPGKKRNRWVVSGAVVSLFMLFIYGNITRQSIINLHRALDPADGARFAPPHGVLSDALIRGLSMEFSLLFVVTVVAALAARELAQPDWDLEWLVTLPLKMPVLLFSRIMERAIANPIGLLTLLPAGTLVAWISGYGWTAPLAGAAAAIPLAAARRSSLRTLVDTGLRMSLSPARLRKFTRPRALGRQRFSALHRQYPSDCRHRWRS